MRRRGRRQWYPDATTKLPAERPKSRRGGSRPRAGRPKVPTEQDPDRFFVVIWRALVQVMGYDPIQVGYLAAHLVSAEPTAITDVGGVSGWRRPRLSTTRAT